MKRWPIFVLVLVCVACGDDETPPTPQERCAADNLPIYVEGSVTTDEMTTTWTHAPTEARGKISEREMQVVAGNVEFGPNLPSVLLNFRENESSEPLLDLLANQTKDGPVELTVIDVTSVPSNAPRRTDLSTFPCGLTSKAACVQVAYDTSRDEVVDESDARVYHAKSGSFTIGKVDNNLSRVFFHFDINLGKNVLTSADTSTGRVQGCVAARYASAGAQGWTLR